MREEIKIKSWYVWWRNPIKWWKDRREIKLMNIMANHWWKNGGEKELAELQADLLFNGVSISKNGKRIDPSKFHWDNLNKK